jgi:hypothetical protein
VSRERDAAGSIPTGSRLGCRFPDRLQIGLARRRAGFPPAATAARGTIRRIGDAGAGLSWGGRGIGAIAGAFPGARRVALD